MTRARTTLRGQSGAFDLPSILVGVVVVGILTAGVLAAIFAVIPWSQDSAAKQDLDAVRTAQGVAQTGAADAPPPGYKSRDELVASHLISKSDGIAVSTNAGRNCYVAVAKSGSGAVFFNTNKTPEPQKYTAGATTPDCDVPLVDVVSALPTSSGGDSGTVVAPALPVASGEILLSPTKADNVAEKRAVSGNGTMTTDPAATMTGWGSAADPGQDTELSSNDGSAVTLAYYDAAAAKYVPFYTHTMDAASGTSVDIIQHDSGIYSNFVDTSAGMTSDEVAGFQKFLDNGGKISFIPAGGTVPAVFVYGPTKDMTGYEYWAAFPVGTLNTVRYPNVSASEASDPAASITQSVATPSSGWDLLNVPGDNGKLLNDTGKETWTVSNVTLQADDWRTAGPPGRFFGAMDSKTMTITVDNGTGTMTIQYQGNTLNSAAVTAGITFPEITDMVISPNVASKLNFSYGGHDWIITMPSTVF